MLWSRRKGDGLLEEACWHSASVPPAWMHGGRSKELIWTPTSEQQFRKILHFACRRLRLPSETQLAYRCCFSTLFHCKAPKEKGEVRMFSQPDPWLGSALAISSCGNGSEDLLPPSCTSLALSRGVLAWP